MNGRLLSLRAVTPEDELAWRDLAARAVEPNPFFEPECLLPAAAFQTFGHELQLLVAEEHGRFYGCVPVRHVKRWHKMPYPIVTTQVRRMPYQGSPLIDPERGVDAASAMLEELAKASRAVGSRVLVLLELNQDGPVDSLFREAATKIRMPLLPFDVFERGMIDRQQGTGSQQRSQQHSAKTLRALRNKRRRLSRSLGSEVTLVDRGHELEAIDDYIELEASGYKAERGVAMATVPGEPEYFRAMCEGFAKANRLHLLSLVVGDRTIAMLMWVRGGSDLFMVKWSYDAKCAQFSPGLQLHEEASRYFYEHTDSALLDSCTSPNNELVLHVYPHRRTIVSYFIFLRRSWLDRVAMSSFLRLRPIHTEVYRRLRPDAYRTAQRGRMAPGMRPSEGPDQARLRYGAKRAAEGPQETRPDDGAKPAGRRVLVG